MIRTLLIALLIAAGAAPAHAARFDRAVVVVFENKATDEVLGSAEAPTFNRLARRYATVPGYTGIAHPSLPNYIAMISGSTQGIRNDCTDCPVSGRSLVNTLEARRRTWKAYAEGLPRAGFTGVSAGLYHKRHNPFVYFRSVLDSPARLRRVVPLRVLRRDLAARRLPHLSFVVPNLCNDMHDCPVRTGDRWLARFLPPLLRSPQMRRGVVFITFDEGEGKDTSGGGGGVATLVVGPRVRRGARATGHFDHYSLLRTIEDAFRLPRLGRSATARPIGGIWR